MKILEVIELRTAVGNVKIIGQYLRDWISESPKEIQFVNGYRHFRLQTDFCVQIRYV
jgi:hypothetical protein